jgi:uncharacterized protein
MTEYSEQDGKLTFRVQVVPRASRSEIVGEHNGALRIRIAAPPVNGAANEELVRTLARALGVRRNAIEITSGQTARTKQVRVTGATWSDLQNLLTKTIASINGDTRNSSASQPN